jgi:uncharacterized metal-binding protein YceD (DUF177 family)
MNRSSLRVPVSDLSGPVERDVTVRASHIDLEPPETQIAVHVTVTKCGKEALIEGTVGATVSVPCAACLGPARVEIDERLNLSMKVPRDGEIDLTGAVRDVFMEGMPMKVKCSPECKGLCPNCGADLNIEKCSCSGKRRRKGSLGIALDEALDRGKS